MNFAIKPILMLLVLASVGCAVQHQQPVMITNSFWGEESKKIGVIMESLPKVNTFFPGAGCLLCMATAEAAHASLSKHVQTLSSSELLDLKNAMAQSLTDRGFEVKIIEPDIPISKLPGYRSEVPNSARKDFSTYKEQYDIDQLLVIDINKLGIIRNYSSYFPTSDPQAAFVAVGFIVNLENNTLVWYKKINLYRSADGEWDEEPEFPGLTNAYYQVIEQGRDSFLEPFLNKDKNI